MFVSQNVMNSRTNSFNRSTGFTKSSSHRNASRKHRASAGRWSCVFPNCDSTFARVHDLVRHQQSVHGPKQPCAFLCCNYATARRDKMNDHVRKIHLRGQDTSTAAHAAVNASDSGSELGMLSEASTHSDTSSLDAWSMSYLGFDMKSLEFECQASTDFGMFANPNSPTWGPVRNETRHQMSMDLPAFSLRDYGARPAQIQQQPVIYECWNCRTQARVTEGRATDMSCKSPTSPEERFA